MGLQTRGAPLSSSVNSKRLLDRLDVVLMSFIVADQCNGISDRFRTLNRRKTDSPRMQSSMMASFTSHIITVRQTRALSLIVSCPSQHVLQLINSIIMRAKPADHSETNRGIRRAAAALEWQPRWVRSDPSQEPHLLRMARVE